MVRIRDKEAEKNYDSSTQKIKSNSASASSSSAVETFPPAGAVLGAATELPATGAPTYTASLFVFLCAGLFRFKISRV